MGHGNHGIDLLISRMGESTKSLKGLFSGICYKASETQKRLSAVADRQGIQPCPGMYVITHHSSSCDHGCSTSVLVPAEQVGACNDAISHLSLNSSTNAKAKALMLECVNPFA